MISPVEELLNRINTADNLRSLVSWANKNKQRLLDKEKQLLHDVSTESQAAYVTGGDCYPPKFVVDRADKIVAELLKK